MIRSVVTLPPPSPRTEERQKRIVGRLISISLVAYAVLTLGGALLGRPLLVAITSGSTLQIGVLIGLVLAVYLVLGGVLCVSFVDQLKHWPPPAPAIGFKGAHFVRTWLWTAPRILVELGTWRTGLRHSR